MTRIELTPTETPTPSPRVLTFVVRALLLVEPGIGVMELVVEAVDDEGCGVKALEEDLRVVLEVVWLLVFEVRVVVAVSPALV